VKQTKYKVVGYGKYGGITCDLEVVVYAFTKIEADSLAREQWKDYARVAIWDIFSEGQ